MVRIKVPEKYSIRKILAKECYPFLKKIHYAKRIPMICHSFGLFNNEKNLLVGVITFGLPPCPKEDERWRSENFNFLELNRLCVIKKLEKNVLSYFVMNSIKLLPDKTALISYADQNQNHSGYIYQATNWIYTGIGAIGTKNVIMKDGSIMHQRTLPSINKFLISHFEKNEKGKHRYFLFKGNKRDRKEFMRILTKRYKIKEYPKDKNTDYEITNKISLQKGLGQWDGTNTDEKETGNICDH